MFLCGCGELNGERGAFAGFTVDSNPPVVSPHGLLHDRQAESRPPAGLFGGEKRLKNLCGMVGFDAVARIGDFDGDRARLVQPPAQRNRIGCGRAQAKRSSVWHCLERIFDQVVECFLHMLPVRLDQWKIRGQFRNASHVLALALGAEEAGTLP